MVPLVAAAGFQWMATDEEILARTLGRGVHARRRRATSSSPRRCIAPYRVGADGRQRRVRIPRSRAVGSDWLHLRVLARRRRRRRFRAAGWPTPGARYAARTGGERRPSSSFSTARTPGSTTKARAGRSCARCIAGSAPHPELRTVTMAEACAAPTDTLPSIFPGLLDQRATSTSGSATRTTIAPGASWPTRGGRSRRRRRAFRRRRWHAPGRRC